MDELIREAAQARVALQQILTECAAALEAAGNVLCASSAAIIEASQRELDATGTYIAALEKIIAMQRGAMN